MRLLNSVWLEAHSDTKDKIQSHQEYKPIG